MLLRSDIIGDLLQMSPYFGWEKKKETENQSWDDSEGKALESEAGASAFLEKLPLPGEHRWWQ